MARNLLPSQVQNLSPEQAITNLFNVADALSELVHLMDDDRPGMAELLRGVNRELSTCAEVLDNAPLEAILKQGGRA